MRSETITEETRSSRRPTGRRFRRRLGVAASVIAVIGACVAIKYYADADPVNAQVPTRRAQPVANRTGAAARTQPPAPQEKIPDLVAVVNGQDILRADLESACIQRHGKEVLEGMVNKHLVTHHCRKRDITVSDAEIDAEIDTIAKRFNLSREQYLDLLVRERDINLDEYRRDTVWAMLALRKLAADQLAVTPEERQRAYETQYGPQVRARLLVVENIHLARQLHAQLLQTPDEFARLAIEKSVDVNSASIGGLIQPIRPHIGDPAIEKAVFQLKEGEISQIIPVGNQFAIVKCEGHIAARQIPLAQVQQEIDEQIKEDKLRSVANDLFGKLQQSATVKNVYNDPTLSQQLPGVVATVNGDKITLKQLGAECALRYGKDVLQIEIGHTLLAQALRASQLAVTGQDMDAEIAHAAELSGVVTKSGAPDIEKWMHMATTEREITRDVYLRDSVWPSAALKKLTGGDVQVVEEDLRKAFEANYGERVRCRAIVMTNQRKAQQVWDMARKNPTVDNFALLAAEYSIEPTSNSLRGEVPPIRRFGGQPIIEEAAFALQPGQVSGILQIADKSVILFCEGRTVPVDVRMEDVRTILHQDIHEKKLRQAMGERFAQMQETARIDNYLTGTSQTPKQAQESQRASTPKRDSAVQPAAAPARRQ